MSAANHDIRTTTYRTRGGVEITHGVDRRRYPEAVEPLVDALDRHRGVLLTSSFEYPGRYTRWDIGFIDPPLEIAARGKAFRIRALNERGEILLPAIATTLGGHSALAGLESGQSAVSGRVRETAEYFPEELRSKQPSVFSVLRALIDLFGAPDDPYLGLYGAFGYELAFQFEAVRRRLERPAGERDLLLYLPDEILLVDHRRETALVHRYDFSTNEHSTAQLPRAGSENAYQAAASTAMECDHQAGEYAATVREAIESFRRGELFEVVPSQTFFAPCPASPAEIFRRLRRRNPAPYGALMNLGEAEYLVAASPEMYVRVEGRRIETCPISGTIARGANPIGDAANIRALLNSRKDESELTMCTDVDRNDKSRVCEAGSVRVIGRRQIEMYSRLIHTVDHVEGRLREGYDALDGFLAHGWAVTVTGAPKQHAIQFLEDHEHSPRRWYGGAIGFIGFNGDMNTGLTLRTVRINKGVAEVRAGATLLFESDPAAEEAETRLKAAAMIDAVLRPEQDVRAAVSITAKQPGAGRKVLIVDHEDSFVHTLAGYFRTTGADVVTYRWGFPAVQLDAEHPDLVLLSPGPGRPGDFQLNATIGAALERRIPLFGVCLGLQGLVEYYGGALDLLPTPVHGKPSRIRVCERRLLADLPEHFEAGRYHSLYALRDQIPAPLEVTAETDDHIVMAIEHRSLPVAAVQFHPESIMSLEDDLGLRLVGNVMSRLATAAARPR